MTKKFSIPRGTKDILPSEIPQWLRMEETARSLLSLYHYKELRTPLFEETELFARSMGQTSDVVQKQMLNLASQKKGSDTVLLSGLSLRPENTASMVRSYIENNLHRKESLSKLFYIGPMFRGERPQKGRLRQFHQIGVEAMGPNTSIPYLDAEVILLSLDLLAHFGVNDFTLKINTLGSPEDKKAFADQLRQKFEDKKSAFCEDCRARLDRNVFRILDCKNKACRQIVQETKIDHSYLCGESNLYYSDVKSILRQSGVAFEECLHLVRGLDYYTHTVFEISCAALGSQDALGAGGRYNSLVPQLGGPAIDAVGFALGMERILLALSEEDPEPEASILDVFIISLREDILPQAFNLLQSLRREGLCADMNLQVSSMKSQMRTANKSGAGHVILLGEEEIEKKEITLKNMLTGTQEMLALKEIKQIAGRIKG